MVRGNLRASTRVEVLFWLLERGDGLPLLVLKEGRRSKLDMLTSLYQLPCRYGLGKLLDDARNIVSTGLGTGPICCGQHSIQLVR